MKIALWLLAALNALYGAFYAAQLHVLPPLWAFGRLTLLAFVPAVIVGGFLGFLGRVAGGVYYRRRY